uniref:Uncharacterized protein n=1 Tax=Megaselia scalaris TaxID=36166 RepID=T1GF63_MEGSC
MEMTSSGSGSGWYFLIFNRVRRRALNSSLATKSHRSGEISPPCDVPLLTADITIAISEITILEILILFTHTTCESQYDSMSRKAVNEYSFLLKVL